MTFIEYRLSIHFVVFIYKNLWILSRFLVSHCALGFWNIFNAPLSLSVELRTYGTPDGTHAPFHFFHVVLHCFHQVFEAKSVFLGVDEVYLALLLRLCKFLHFVNIQHAL